MAHGGQQVTIEMQDGVVCREEAGRRPPPLPQTAGGPPYFRVYAGAGDVPPMHGRVCRRARRADVPAAVPRVARRARARRVSRGPCERIFDIPKRELRSTTRVVQVYPSASEFPENQLKFYIEFSAPMSHGEAWKHIRLLKANGARG